LTALCARGEELRQARQRREKEQSEAKRKAHLDGILAKLPSVWQQVEDLANLKKVNEYDVAVELLVDLRDLAARGDIADFPQRMNEFRMRHHTKRALLERLDRANV